MTQLGRMRVLFKSRAKFFPRARVLDKAFKNFETHESRTYIVRYGGRKRFLRVPLNFATKSNAACDFAMLKIFNILYPRHSIKPVGVTVVKGDIKLGIDSRYGVVSEIVRGLSKDYLQYQEDYYRTGEAGVKSNRHNYFCDTVGAKVAEKIYAESGIRVQRTKPNIGEVNGTPIFFESYLDLMKFDRFRTYVQTQEPEKVKEIIDLLEIIKKASKRTI